MALVAEECVMGLRF